MIDIFIKSYNRPYFLDRCLYSLFKYASGSYRVTIWDDGTPEKYLSAIQEKYPLIQILDTPNAAKKRVEIEQANQINDDSAISGGVPLAFWREQIVNGSDIFLLWEDDIWLHDTLDIDAYAALMLEKPINLIKVRWWGNENTNVGIVQPLTNEVEAIQPKLHWLAEALVKNKFYLNSISNLLKLKKDSYFLQLYTYYEVGDVFFNKKYWLYLWPEHLQQIEEMIQLGKAAEWARKNPATLFCKCMQEKGHSTYLSSATGKMNEKDGFSMFRVNYLLNEAWLNGELNALENFPLNISVERIEQILSQASDINGNPEKWKQWTENFQRHFVSIGCSELG